MTSIDDFDVGTTLGTGSFGRVRFATHLDSKNHFAVKMLKKAEVVRSRQVNSLSPTALLFIILN